jgi:hypothetical protein
MTRAQAPEARLAQAAVNALDIIVKALDSGHDGTTIVRWYGLVTLTLTTVDGVTTITYE